MNFPGRTPAWRRYLHFWRGDIRGDVDDELRFHLDERVEELVAQGMDRGRAREQAIDEFGNVADVRGDLCDIDSRIARRRSRLEAVAVLWQDLRYAARALGRSPGLTATIVVTLALGLGLNSAMFTFLDRVFLRPPSGVADPSTLRRVWFEHFRTADGIPFSSEATSYYEYQVVSRAAGRNGRLSFYSPSEKARLAHGADVRDVRVQYAASDLLPLLGVRPRIGRFFSTDEGLPDAGAQVAVVSSAFWARHMEQRRDILGAELTIDGRKYQVVGVAPEDFAGVDLQPVDIWLPLGA